MKDNLDDKLDYLSSNIMKEIPLESPSKNFTNAVMSVIDMSVIEVKSEYKPLISNLAWGIIGFVFLAFFAILFQNDSNSISFGFEYFNTIEFNAQQFISNLSPKIYLSNIYVYAIVATISLFIGQIIFIANRYSL